MTLLPPPFVLGLPERFASWRPRQDEMIHRAVTSPKRFVVIVAPTGFGKEGVGVGAIAWNALLEREKAQADPAYEPLDRGVYLTATRGLQDQIVRECAEAGLVDIRGQGNYDCRLLVERLGAGKCDAGPCHAGGQCAYRFRGCEYYDRVEAARRAVGPVPNYAYWLRINQGEEGLGRGIGILVCDEAHETLEQLFGVLGVEITNAEIEQVLGARMPKLDSPLDAWVAWARNLGVVASRELDALGAYIRLYPNEVAPAEFKRFRQLRDLVQKLVRIGGINPEERVEAPKPVRDYPEGVPAWVHEVRGADVRFDPVWPAAYREALFQDIPKVVLMSATIRRKVVEKLGIREEEMDFVELASSFPAPRRPVICVPKVVMRYGMSAEDEAEWVRAVDTVLALRRDRKVIVHTVSFDRALKLLGASRFASSMYVNEPKAANLTQRAVLALAAYTGPTKEVVARYKHAAPGAVLVSPSVATGFDFPYELCETQIIVKVPFPSVKESKVSRVRQAVDPDWVNYLAMTEVVQASGRGMRAEDDRCETIILDGQWSKWFWWNNRKHAPDWFNEAVRTEALLPRPMEKLR